MFKNLSIKWQLGVLVSIMVLAMAVLVFLAHSGLEMAGDDISEIGNNRLPSVQGLLIISEGRTVAANHVVLQALILSA